MNGPEISIERMLIVAEKLREANKLAQRMDEISANFAKVSPALDMKAAALGKDIRVPPEVAAEINEFLQIQLELEKLFNIQPESVPPKTSH